MAKSDRRQFVKYSFYKVDPAWRRLPQEWRTSDKRRFASVVEEFSTTMAMRSYSLVGLRGDADFLLWQAADSLEAIQEVATTTFPTALRSIISRRARGACSSAARHHTSVAASP